MLPRSAPPPLRVHVPCFYTFANSSQVLPSCCTGDAVPGERCSPIGSNNSDTDRAICRPSQGRLPLHGLALSNGFRDRDLIRVAVSMDGGKIGKSLVYNFWLAGFGRVLWRRHTWFAWPCSQLSILLFLYEREWPSWPWWDKQSDLVLEICDCFGERWFVSLFCQSVAKSLEL